jgi:hypothetical protein
MKTSDIGQCLGLRWQPHHGTGKQRANDPLFLNQLITETERSNTRMVRFKKLLPERGKG